MINKINKIKNLGIFSDFKWDTKLHNFNRFNLIFGWNGCGKTTLSRLFTALEEGTLNGFSLLEYEVEDSAGQIFKQNEVFNKKVRVFNQDYIINNVFPLEKKAKLIYILGEANKKIAEQIQTDEELIAQGRNELKRLEALKQDKKEKKDKTFTDIASLISLNVSGLTSRTYRRPDAEENFKTLDNKETLAKDDLRKFTLTIGQQEKPLISTLKMQYLNSANTSVNVTKAIDDLVAQANKLLITTVESIVIDRLKNNPEVAEWVEQGLFLRDRYYSKTCEFCDQAIPKSRIENLSSHFNKADKQLKKEIDEAIAELRAIYSSIDKAMVIDKANLYEELQKDYQLKADIYNKEKIKVLSLIIELANKLKDKKFKTTESIVAQEIIKTQLLNDKLNEVNDLIDKHNDKVKNLKTEKDIARNSLERHYLSTIYDDVKELENGINSLNNEIDKLINGDPKNIENIGMIALKKRNEENKIKSSSSHKACAEINDNLQAFLGTDELTFEVEKEGYAIKRNNEVATHLSEGEKTAIAFVYFTIHLKDKDFNLKNDVVIIDDPISSLDSNVLFRVGAFIESKLRKTGQLFILTHNYDFFNQMKKWFFNDLNNKEKDPSLYEGNYFMIKNYVDKNILSRAALITDLDPLLRDYESEYHFLFSKLYSFKKDVVGSEKGNILTIYPYPNFARKFLECFLSFRIPKGGSFYAKLMSLKSINKSISSSDLSEVYNFVNSHSHLDTKTGLLQFDPTLTLSGEKCIDLILKIVGQADEKHFKAMENVINKVTVGGGNN